MPIAHVQTASLGDSTGVAAFIETSVGNTTTGNCLIVACVWYGGPGDTITFSSITDDGSLTWNQAGTELRTNTRQYLRLYYAFNITGRSAHKVRLTVSAGGGYPSIIIGEYSGLMITDPFDVTAGTNGGSSTTPASGATSSRAQAEELMIGVCTPEFGSAQTQTAGTNVPWTIPANGAINNGTLYTCCSMEYFLATSTGTQQATMTLSLSTFWAIRVATFKAGVFGSPSAWIRA